MNTLIWFRNDLRILDNETLVAAARAAESRLAYVFVYDPRWDSLTPEKQPRLGKFRKAFLKGALRDLRKSLRECGGDLICVYGRPEDIIPQICDENSITRVFLSGGFAYEERKIEDTLRERLSRVGKSVFSFATHTLLHPADLPFKVHELPMIFTEFRKRVETACIPRPLMPAPSKLPAPLQLNSLPLWELDSAESAVEGESAAHARVKDYIWDKDRLRVYKETRNGLLAEDDSSKLSAYLAHGCVSAKWLAEEVRRYENERLKNDSTYWLIFELLWRDYFQFLSLKFNRQIFLRDGLKKPREWEAPPGAQTRFAAWCAGQTGYPLVDASMRELALTGFMSGRGRQNVASFLTHNLKLDWRQGARWFESWLVDYDVASNWGNWTYVAGVGTDPRPRIFNVVKQSFDYDPKAEYVHHWIPELAVLQGAEALTPWENPLYVPLYPPRIVPALSAQA